ELPALADPDRPVDRTVQRGREHLAPGQRAVLRGVHPAVLPARVGRGPGCVPAGRRDVLRPLGHPGGHPDGAGTVAGAGAAGHLGSGWLRAACRHVAGRTAETDDGGGIAMGDLGHNLSCYYRMAMAQARSQMQYRVNFFAHLIGIVLTYAGQFIALAWLTQRFTTVGGWRFEEIILLYAMAILAWGFAVSFFWSLIGFEDQ